MTYIVAEKPNEDNSVVHVETREEAEEVVMGIINQIKAILNNDSLKITRKEDDVIIKFEGALMAKLQILDDDEVDPSGLR